MSKIKNNSKSDQKNTLEYYVKLPYTLVITPEESGGFFVKVEELPGCISQGNSIEEAISNIEDAKRVWLKTALERKIETPLPDSMREYSGRFVVRIPASLHRRIAVQSRKEGVSLNQMVLAILSEQNGFTELKREFHIAIAKTQGVETKKTSIQRDKPVFVSDVKNKYKTAKT